VPKGPSLDPSIKRLAVQVEDHPIEYGSFEGTIPKGSYGGGTVMLWDRGTWEDQSGPAAGYQKGDLKFILKGKKLHGAWKLIRLKNDPKNWLLIKVADKEAHSENELNILEHKPLSVLSGKSLDKIAKASGPAKNKIQKKETPTKKRVTKNLTPLKKINFPDTIHPQLATLVDTPPAGDDWLHEIKFDGYRIICYIRNNSIQLFTRNQLDWTHKMPVLANALKKLKIKNAILDGELVVLNQQQHSDFQLLQNTLHHEADAALVYCVFDIIYHDGYDLRKLSLLERKTILKDLIGTQNFIRYSDHVIGNGELVFAKACELGLEGIVSKNIHSPYVEKRTQQWLKSKCTQQQEFVIVGYTEPQGNRKYFGSLLLGYYADHTLHYCGHVGTGFNQASLALLYKLFHALKTSHSLVKEIPHSLLNAHGVTWVKPKLVVEVEFSQWTHDGVLRHPSFKGLRKDKPAQQVVREQALPVEKKPARKKTTKNSSMQTPYKLSHPERILYPEQSITKKQLAEFYQNISEWILPHIINRPLTLVRCPQGWQKDCFYQKHIGENLPEGLYAIPIKERHSQGKYIYLKDLTGLIGLVQLGVLEIHPWNCHIDNIEKPDQLIFDLDPGSDVPWSKVVKTAKFIREMLAELKLVSFVKTTGGKGLHIVLPLQPEQPWSETVAFAHAFANSLAELKPEEYIATMSKTKREGKIFIDYLRNNRGATAVAAYSTRARKNAPVSTPLRWDELTGSLKSDAYHLRNLPTRLARLKKDPWEGFFRVRQTLPRLK